MTTELYNLELDEVSLVMAGDDPLAKVAIIKCRDIEKEKESTMTEEMKAKLKPYLDKGMSEEDAKKAYDENMEKSVETTKAENERLRKALLDEGYKITAEGVEKKAPEEMIDVDGEMVAKSAIPAPVLKALEAAEVAKKDAVLVQKAKENLPNFDEAVAKSFMGMDLSEDQLAALKAADALFGKMTEEVGKTDTNGDLSDPKSKLDALVKATAEEKNITKEAAFTEVSKTKEGKDLINKTFYKKED